MSKKESAAKAAKTPKETSVEEMILNFPEGKYSAIPLAAQWAKVLRRKEEHRHLTSNEILELALKDVLSGVVDWKDVKKAIESAPPAEGLLALNGADDKKK